MTSQAIDEPQIIYENLQNENIDFMTSDLSRI
jgi:hypothetical protein